MGTKKQKKPVFILTQVNRPTEYHDTWLAVIELTEELLAKAERLDTIVTDARDGGLRLSDVRTFDARASYLTFDSAGEELWEKLSALVEDEANGWCALSANDVPDSRNCIRSESDEMSVNDLGVRWVALEKHADENCEFSTPFIPLGALRELMGKGG